MGNKLDSTQNGEFVSQDYVHNCKLPREVEVISYFIPDNKRFQQWFRKMCLISSNVSHRKLYVKSFRALEQDRAMHLSHEYYIIHPFSAFRFYWEVFMTFMLIMQILIRPMLLMQHTYFCPIGISAIEVFQLAALCNIIVQFMSGYFEKSTKTIILEPKRIVKNYLKHFFIWDFVGNIPVELLFYVNSESPHFIKARVICLKGLLNIVSLMDYTEKLREKRQYPLCIYRLFQFIFIYISGMVWICVVMRFAVGLDQGEIPTKDIMWSLVNNVFVLIFTLGQREFSIHGYELYVHFIAITFGFIMRSIIIAQVVLLYKSTFSSKRKYTQLVAELTEFSHFKRLPRDIKERIFNYYNFVFQHYYYNESEIWNLMSDKLKYEIDKNLYKIWFEADIFLLCPPQLMQSLVPLLKREIYLVGDVIYACNTPADYIYFLKHGTVALYDNQNNELAHVKQGSFFSDSALNLEVEIVNESTAVAIHPCEVYKLHREDFREVIQHFPEEYEKILAILMKRRDRKQSISVLDSSNYAENKKADENEQDKENNEQDKENNEQNKENNEERKKID